MSYGIKLEKPQHVSDHLLDQLKSMGESLEDDGMLLYRIAASAEAARIVGAQEKAANLLQLDLAHKSAEVICVSASDILEIDGALTAKRKKCLDEEAQEINRDKCFNLMTEVSSGGGVEPKSESDIDCDSICPASKINKLADMHVRRPQKHEAWSLSALVTAHEEASLHESRISTNSYDEAMLMMPLQKDDGQERRLKSRSHLKAAQKRISSIKCLADAKRIVAPRCAGQIAMDCPKFAASALILRAPFRVCYDLLGRYQEQLQAQLKNQSEMLAAEAQSQLGFSFLEMEALAES